MTSEAPRRIVTGHDDAGRSIVLADGPAPARTIAATGVTFHEVWATADAPAPIAAVEPVELADGPLMVQPGERGTIVHLVDMPPGSSAPMHRTKTVDYGIVLEGEIDLELDDGSETHLGPGDLVVQRGTAHAWYNRSDRVTRMLFVLVDGAFTDELRSALGAEALANVLDRPLD
jgi:quercetin dioxygenase-like cupin family protein